jgi:TM2 domain-containing membrane protein YozV
MTDQIIIQRRPPKSPAAAGILSGVFPGAGQLYNGEPMKALLFFIIFAGSISMMPHGPHPFVPLVFAAFYFYQIIEAVQTAKAINQKALTESGPAPAATAPSAAVAEARPAPRSGSAFWGLILMGLGVIFLLSNFEIIDYDRIFEFWPVILVVIGLKMIFDYSVKKKA